MCFVLQSFFYSDKIDQYKLQNVHKVISYISCKIKMLLVYILFQKDAMPEGDNEYGYEDDEFEVSSLNLLSVSISANCVSNRKKCISSVGRSDI